MTFKPGDYWEERLRSSFDERGVGDISLPRSYNKYLYGVRRRVFGRAVKRISVDLATARVLDVGAGTGFYVREWLSRRVGDLTGLDISPTAIARLKATFPEVTFVNADIAELSAPEAVGRFDIVSAFDVLFHIVDDVRYKTALANIAAILRQGGWFLYSDNLVPTEARIEHQVSRSEREILLALERSGFEVVSRIPMFVLMNDPVRASNPLAQRWFSRVTAASRKSERWGEIIGGLLYPLEIAATRLVAHGPSTEVLLCRRCQA